MFIASDSVWVATTDGRILRMNKDGADVVEVAKGQPTRRQIVADATGVYWVNSGTGEVSVVGSGGTTVRTLASDQRRLAGQRGITSLAIDATHVYWVTFASVMRVPKCCRPL